MRRNWPSRCWPKPGQGRQPGRPRGLLSGLTARVLATALEAAMSERLGHDRGQTPAGSNVRNATRCKTVITEIGLCRRIPLLPRAPI